MKIIKFGGSVLKSKSGFEKMAEILSAYSKGPLLIVVSAFSRATRDLEQAAIYAELGNEEISGKILNEVIQQHYQFAEELLSDIDKIEELKGIYDSGAKQISDFLRGISITKELTRRTLDAVLSFGEFFALHTVCCYLAEQGFEIDCVDAASIIITDENFGKAIPIYNATRKKVEQFLLPELKKNKIILTQGFVAKTHSGEISTMGIESSNLTAALLAELIGADELVLYTDVEGIRSADPKLIDNTHSIKRLTYDNAYIVSSNGLKLIYPSMLHYAKRANIKLTFRSAFNPEGDSSVVFDDSNEEPHSMIIIKEGLNLLRVAIRSADDKVAADNLLRKISFIQNELFTYHFYPDSLSITSARDFSKINIPSELDYQNYKNFSILTLVDIHEHSVIEAFRDFKPLLSNETPCSIEVGKSEIPSRIIVPGHIAIDLARIIHKNMVI